jgi:hypothetical protein
MDIRCPLPLERPWSPVGYNVVEVANDLVPVVRPLTPEQAAAPEPWLPSSPVGYRVSVVAEEITPPKKRVVPSAVVNVPHRRRHRQPLPPRSAAMIWGPVVMGAAAVVMFMLVMIAIRISTWTPPAEEAPRQIAFFQPVVPIQAPAVPEVVLPAVDRDDPIEVDPNLPEPNPAGNEACRVEPPVKLPQDRETFGTSVAFARNVKEGCRLAAEERKLAFVLHVSGNFEESRFT